MAARHAIKKGLAAHPSPTAARVPSPTPRRVDADAAAAAAADADADADDDDDGGGGGTIAERWWWWMRGVHPIARGSSAAACCCSHACRSCRGTPDGAACHARRWSLKTTQKVRPHMCACRSCRAAPRAQRSPSTTPTGRRSSSTSTTCECYISIGRHEQLGMLHFRLLVFLKKRRGASSGSWLANLAVKA